MEQLTKQDKKVLRDIRDGNFDYSKATNEISLERIKKFIASKPELKKFIDQHIKTAN